MKTPGKGKHLTLSSHVVLPLVEGKAVLHGSPRSAPGKSSVKSRTHIAAEASAIRGPLRTALWGAL